MCFCVPNKPQTFAALIFLVLSLLGMSNSTFVVFHGANEGSHAFVEYLSHCQHLPIHGEEFLDEYANKILKSNGNLNRLVKSFLDGPKQYEEVATKLNFTRPMNSIKNSNTQSPFGYGILIRTDHDVICSSPSVTDVWITVRTDLLRYSISDYDTETAGFGHAQFNGEKHIAQHSIDTRIFGENVKKKMQVWKHQIYFATKVQECGKNVKFVIYEIFEDVQPSCAELESSHGVHRVHGHRITDLIANAAEVIKFVNSGNYPSWGSLLHASKFKVQNDSIWKVGDMPHKGK